MTDKFPVLLLLFNRPDLTEGVVRKLKHYSPNKLYIAIDGPRTSQEGEAALCLSVREIVDKMVDWPCGKEWLVREWNLGCGPAVKTALDWFFEHEESGMILEDDCHPSPDFFRFQQEMLQSHRDDERIFMVSGNNFLPECVESRTPVYLSKYTSIWGWGTWRRSWLDYQFTYSEDESTDWQHVIQTAACSSAESVYWMKEFNKLCGVKTPHTWDIQLQFSVWKHGRKNIFPSKNLVTNHGLRSDATHTRNFNERLFRTTRDFKVDLLNGALPSYDPDIDLMLFWLHVLEGNSERFKQLLLDADPESHKNIEATLDAIRLREDPSLADLISLANKWVRKQISRVYLNLRKK